MPTQLPTNRIKKVKLPNNTEYEIIPAKMQSNGYQATLPNLSADDVIVTTNTEQTISYHKTFSSGLSITEAQSDTYNIYSNQSSLVFENENAQSSVYFDITNSGSSLGGLNDIYLSNGKLHNGTANLTLPGASGTLALTSYVWPNPQTTTATLSSLSIGDTDYKIIDTGATSVETTGTGNAVTTASYDSTTRKITLTKGSTFLTSESDTLATVTGRGATTSTEVILNGGADVTGGTLKMNVINAKTGSSATTYGPGTSGQVLKSNGTNAYWGNDSSDTTTQGVGANYKWKDQMAGYQIGVLDKDNKIVPMVSGASGTASTGTSKTMNTTSFNPFGLLMYTSSSSYRAADALCSSSTFTALASVDLRYSFNCGSTLTANTPVYIVAQMQSDGQAKLVSPYYTQSLPSSDNGLIYIYLGQAISTTNINLQESHPVYYYKEGKVRLFTKELAKVSFTGSYNDLTNKPTIPTVNNGILTIQGNGTTASTFTANQSSNTTLNIKGSGATTVTKSADNEITISSTDNNDDHYPTTFAWTNGTTAGPTGSLTGNSGFTAVSFGAIPAASANQSGIVTTGTQAFNGQKSFKDWVFMSKGLFINSDNVSTGDDWDACYGAFGISISNESESTSWELKFPELSDSDSATLGLQIDIVDLTQVNS